VTDTATNEKVWDIVTNPEAIAVNQAWAGHPGFLAFEVDAASNSTDGSGLFAWAVDCDASATDQLGWAAEFAFPRAGSVFAGAGGVSQLCQGGLCLDAASPSELVLSPRDAGSSTQAFDLAEGVAEGVAGPVTQGGQCVDVFNFEGPVVELYDCNGGSNQAFALDAGAGTISSGGGKCLAGRSASPSGGSEVVQVWAKPLAGGAVAALVLSNAAVGSAPVSVQLPFGALGIADGANVVVRDVWARSDVGTFIGAFDAPPVAPHDSLFYVLTPN